MEAGVVSLLAKKPQLALKSDPMSLTNLAHRFTDRMCAVAKFVRTIRSEETRAASPARWKRTRPNTGSIRRKLSPPELMYLSSVISKMLSDNSVTSSTESSPAAKEAALDSDGWPLCFSAPSSSAVRSMSKGSVTSAASTVAYDDDGWPLRFQACTSRSSTEAPPTDRGWQRRCVHACT